MKCNERQSTDERPCLRLVYLENLTQSLDDWSVEFLGEKGFLDEFCLTEDLEEAAIFLEIVKD